MLKTFVGVVAAMGWGLGRLTAKLPGRSGREGRAWLPDEWAPAPPDG